MSAEDRDIRLAELERLRSEIVALSAERQRLVEMLLLAERDRQLLGYELHDGIVQNLSAAVMLLEGGLDQVGFHSPEQRERFNQAIGLLRGGIVEVRRLVGGLAAVELADATLGEALQRLVERYRTQYSLNVDYEGDLRYLGLAPASRYLLLRIAQEALNNAWKHAPTSHVQVRLSVEEGMLELSIADNGAGFDPKQNKPGHFGLDGMRARAHLLGAEFKLDSGAGQGTCVAVRLSLPRK